MKNLFLTIAFLSSFVIANAQTTPNSDKKADIQFAGDSHDFGNIKEGTMATHEFIFKNTGTEPLVLSDVHPSCGCTTPEWPKEPIAPGASATIKAIFNSNGRPGAFTKSITVTSNASSGQKVITFRGVVEPVSSPSTDVPSATPTPTKAENTPKVIKAPTVSSNKVNKTPVKPIPSKKPALTNTSKKSIK